MSNEYTNRWTLFIGTIPIGELIFVSYETPWVWADFVPTAEFARFIPYFDWVKNPTPCISQDISNLIAEVGDAGDLSILDQSTKQRTDNTMLNFGKDYSYAWFRP